MKSAVTDPSPSVCDVCSIKYQFSRENGFLVGLTHGN